MSHLDPDPRNKLGKGILAPGLEAALRAQGVIFADFIAQADGHKILVTSKRRMADVTRDWYRTAQRLPKLTPVPELAAG